jgi:transcription elongation factor GreA
MINKKVVLTYEGLKKLEDELEILKGVKRREIAERIKQALSFGDISENSEYDEAKNDQAQMEVRIIQLETMLKNAIIIDEDDIDTERVSVGTKVKLLDLDSNEEYQYYIVGSTETDPGKSKISNESPIGKALIGKQKGDIVEILVPDGMIRFEILNINK